MPNIEKLDWNQAFDEFILVHKPAGMKQYQFAALKEVDVEWLSTKFTEIRNERLMTKNKSRLPKLLSKALDGLESALGEEVDREVADKRTGIGVEAKAKLSLAAVTGIADRLGMSPQAMTINMQQLTQNKTILAVPIFAAEYSQELDNFLGKTVDKSNAKVIDANDTTDS